MGLFITQGCVPRENISNRLEKEDRYTPIARACPQAAAKLVSLRCKGRRGVDSLHRLLPLVALSVASLLASSISIKPATAQDSSPYVVGHWRLNDSFRDFTPGAAIKTANTDFVFVNPTDLTLTLEYAFFDPDGTFCGCDRDTLNPNGRTRYTMLGEKQAKIFSTALCPKQTEGELKSIVFTGVDNGNVVVGDALQAGIQIHIFASAQGEESDSNTPREKSESNLQGVTINAATTREMNNIHQQCVKFIGAP